MILFLKTIFFISLIVSLINRIFALIEYIKKDIFLKKPLKFNIERDKDKECIYFTFDEFKDDFEKFGEDFYDITDHGRYSEARGIHCNPFFKESNKEIELPQAIGGTTKEKKVDYYYLDSDPYSRSMGQREYETQTTKMIPIVFYTNGDAVKYFEWKKQYEDSKKIKKSDELKKEFYENILNKAQEELEKTKESSD